MEKISVKRKPFIIGVMGSHRDESAAIMEAARRLGEAIARRGYVLLTGGGPGVMEAASEGAYRAGGLVIGILPNDKRHPLEKYPNQFVDIPIYTGMSDARNVINAKTPHVLVALRGRSGNLVRNRSCPAKRNPGDRSSRPAIRTSGRLRFHRR